MKFKFYDILSTLLPGFLLYFVVLHFTEWSLENVNVLFSTVIAFILGYFVNTISSWLEEVYYFTWKGRPSDKLLQGVEIWKVPFYHSKEIRTLLLQEAKKLNLDSDASDGKLFVIAKRYALSENSTRIADFNASYAFSRVILTSIIMVSAILACNYYHDIYFYAICIPLVIIAWLRCKQRGYYYAREVLETYLKSKNN